MGEPAITKGISTTGGIERCQSGGIRAKLLQALLRTSADRSLLQFRKRVSSIMPMRASAIQILLVPSQNEHSERNEHNLVLCTISKSLTKKSAPPASRETTAAPILLVQRLTLNIGIAVKVVIQNVATLRSLSEIEQEERSSLNTPRRSVNPPSTTSNICRNKEKE